MEYSGINLWWDGMLFLVHIQHLALDENYLPISAPSKPVCRDFGSMGFQTGSTEVQKLEQKGNIKITAAP